MQIKANRHPRSHTRDRAFLLLLLAITPSFAVHMFLRLVYEDRFSATELTIAVVSTVFHACLIAIVPLRREGDGLRVLVTSTLALTLIASAAPLYENTLHLPHTAQEQNLELTWLGLGWSVGAVLVAMLRTLSRGQAELGEFNGAWLPKATHVLISVTTFSVVFWLLAGLDSIMAGATPGLKDLSNALFLAFLPVASASATRRILAQTKRYAPGRMNGTLIAAYLASLISLFAIAQTPDIHLLENGSSSILLIITVILAMVLIGRPLADLAAVVMLNSSTALLVPFSITAELPSQVVALMLFLAVFAALLLPVKERQGLAEKGILPPSSRVMGALQDRLGTFTLNVNFDQNIVQFPFGGGTQFGTDGDLSLTEFFRLAPMKGVLDLMQKLQRGETPTGLKLQFRLRKRGPVECRQEWIAQPFTVHVIENNYPNVWIALARESNETEDLSEQRLRLTALLEAALKREDRFMMALKHDLRAPIFTLSNLIDTLDRPELKTETLPAMHYCIETLRSSLNDLEFMPEPCTGSIGSSSLTLREFARRIEQQFQECFGKGNQELRISLPDHADTMLRSDHGWVQVSLIRLLDNAFRHSGATEISLSIFVTADEGDRMMVSLHLSDNGNGLTSEQRLAAFDPLAAVSRKAGSRIGLGIYAVRQAMRAMGGDIVLQATPKGGHFVMSYPATIIANSFELPQNGAVRRSF